MASPQPPPEAVLIARKREEAPRMSIRAAAEQAGISETRWRQIESGRRMFQGKPWPERAPAAILARMARVVSVTATELEKAGRPDAAAELDALPLPEVRRDEDGHETATSAELQAVMDRLDRIEEALTQRANGPRRAG